MDDKTKNMVLWFSTLPLFFGGVTYSITKDLLISGYAFGGFIPVSIFAAYTLYKKASGNSQ